MKKLIIAAAVAVVSIGAFAADGYDFTATLKTTKGKSGKITKPVKLGVNDGGKFWYQDTKVATYFTVNMPVVTLTAEGKKYFELDASKTGGAAEIPVLNSAGLENKTLLALLATLESEYGNPSSGKWCLTFKFVTENCYRIAGTAKIDVDLFTSNCCAVAESAVYITNYFKTATSPDTAVAGGIMFGPATTNAFPYAGFVYRFGSLDYKKATKVEMFASAGNMPTTDNREFLMGALAGQGTFSKDRVDSVSGNIVGIMTPALCPNCCTLPTAAIAFICNDATPIGGVPVVDMATALAIPDGTLTVLPTAAYGTFRLKYNSKLKQDQN